MSELCYLCLAGPAFKRVPKYNIQVCRGCWDSAEQGWPQQFEGSLFQALSRAGLLIPDRNARHLLPRDYAPPDNFAL